MNAEVILCSSIRPFALALILSVGCAGSALAAPTELGLSDASVDPGSTPVMLQFPIGRDPDLGFDVALDYHTVDGSAIAGTDYTGVAAGRALFPAGASASNISIPVSGHTTGGAARDFQLQIDAATGIGPAPSFAAGQHFSIGADAYHIASGDFNGDGKLDVVISEATPNRLWVALNTSTSGGPPSFGTALSIGVAASPTTIALADFDLDGRLDLVVSNAGAGVVSVLRNGMATGATMPSFDAPLALTTGGTPIDLAAGDLDNDGYADILVTLQGSSSILVLHNTTTTGAAPSFGTAQPFFVPQPQRVAIAEINGDGRADLIVNFGPSVGVLLNTTPIGGALNFSPYSTFASGFSTDQVTTGDVNGDGRADIVMAHTGQAAVAVFINSTIPGATTASFGAQQLFPAGGFPVDVIVCDLNGDAKPELVVSNLSFTPIYVLRNRTKPGAASASFMAAQTFAAGATARAVTAGDFNNDGKLDLLVANDFEPNPVVLALNTTPAPGATLSFDDPQDLSTGGGVPYAVHAADVNSDGRPDLLVAQANTNSVELRMNNGAVGAVAPIFAAAESFPTPVNPHFISSADIDGNGSLDIVVLGQSTNEVTVLANGTLPGSGSGMLTRTDHATGALLPFTVDIADLDGDGRPDLVVPSFTDSTVKVLRNTAAAGSPPTFSPTSYATATSPSSAIAADVNGDGRPDLVTANFGAGNVSVRLNASTPGALAFAATALDFATGSAPRAIAAADIDDDGKLDLVVANYGADNFTVLRNISTPAAADFAGVSFPAGAAPIAIAVRDLDGDGRRDVLATNYVVTGSVSVVRNLTSVASGIAFAAPQPFSVGGSPISTAISDLNGDGRPDLVTANNSSSSVSITVNSQYRAQFTGSPATGTINHDRIFGNSFD